MNKLELLQLRKENKTLREIAILYSTSKQRIHQIIGNTGRVKRIPNGFSKCYRCLKLLPLSEFYDSLSARHSCKICLKKSSLKYSHKYIIHYLKGGKYHQSQLARMAVYHAIKRGDLIKPSKCQINNNCYGRLEAHHYKGYDKDNYLNVLWLCSKHHEIFDKNDKKVYKKNSW